MRIRTRTQPSTESWESTAALWKEAPSAKQSTWYCMSDQQHGRGGKHYSNKKAPRDASCARPGTFQAVQILGWASSWLLRLSPSFCESPPPRTSVPRNQRRLGSTRLKRSSYAD